MLVAAVLAVATITPVTASGAPSVRGFDGKTITTAGLAVAANFADAAIGTQARFKRFNDNNEIKGIKLKFTELADDQQDPARATSEARRLVTQLQVFAIVPSVSAVTPGPYLNQQHVPYFGWGIDNTYCSTPKPSTKLYGFGYNGCIVPADPPYMPDSFVNEYKYVSQKTGKKHPSIVLFSNDNQSGKNASRLQATSAQGAGFKVVYAKGAVPISVSDYTPYVQEWLGSDGGKQPDDIHCLLALQCIDIFKQLKPAGFTGTYWTPLYADQLLKALGGTIVSGFYNTEPNPAFTQFKDDLEAAKSGSKPTLGTAAGYFGADMFITALKKVAKKGKSNITPENVQKAASTMKWQIKGFVGPTIYPDATVISTKSCSSLLEPNADGTAWNTLQPFSCSPKKFKVDSKFKG